MIRVLSVSSSRADLAALAPVWFEIVAQGGIALKVAFTGMHLADEAGLREARSLLPSGIASILIGEDLGGGNAVIAARAASMSEIAFASQYANDAPDLLLVMGDRLDMLPAAVAALPFNIPIAHIHGGELTFGAVDDRIRHALSKLSHLHFVSGVMPARRLAAMGEDPDRIHVVGAPGIDTLARTSRPDRESFFREIGFLNGAPFLLVTVHPETNSAEPLAVAKAVLGALADCSYAMLFTAPNSDVGGGEIGRMIEGFVSGRSNVLVCKTLGQRLYAAAMEHAALMVGNSSSGIIEAGFFGLPVVNVGERQAGRDRSLNVFDVPSDIVRVRNAISAAVGRRFDPKDTCIYGDGAASARVAAVVRSISDPTALLTKRHFEGNPTFALPWAGDFRALRLQISAPEAADVVVTRSDLVAGLRALGVRPGHVILCHTALSSIGYVVGGARTVIEAMIEAVGSDGTIVMPAFSGDMSDPAEWRYPPIPSASIPRMRDEMPGYCKQRTPTRNMGVVAELFRNWPGTQRSSHPQSSFAALGRDAEAILCNHSLDYRFGPMSPLGRLEDFDARIVSIGAPWNTFSILYRSQSDGETEVRSYPVAVDGRTNWIHARDFLYTNYWFFDFINYLIDKDIAIVRNFGKATSLAFDARIGLVEARRFRAERAA